MNDAQGVTCQPRIQECNMQTFNIGGLITHLILNSEKTNTQILEAVHKTFPSAKTSMACVAWYKSKLRKEGKLEAKSSKHEVKLTEEQLAELIG